MNDKLLIPDLKEQLKIMLLEFIRKYKDTKFDYNRSYYKYYYRPRDNRYDIDDVTFFDKVLDKVIYHMENSDVIRNLIHLDEIISCDSCTFSFTGLEQGEEIPIIVYAPFYNETNESYNHLGFNIAPSYIDELHKKATPQILYKDIGYFKDKQSISVTEYNQIAVHWQLGQIISQEGIPDGLASKISNFIFSNDLYIMNIETANRNINEFYSGTKENPILLVRYHREGEENMQRPTPNDIKDLKSIQENMAKGIRLYKIPNIEFNWQPYLDKIEKKFKRLRKVGGEARLVEDYICYTKYNLSMEYSPDNYLEIYGTQDALTSFLLGSNIQGTGFEMRYCSEYKFLHLIDHFAGDCSFYYYFEANIFQHHFGSKQNKLCDDFAFYCINYY